MFVKQNINIFFTEADVEYYLNKTNRISDTNGNSYSSECMFVDGNRTISDLSLAENDFDSTRNYDAFVLYADEDTNFAVDLITRMENCGFSVSILRYLYDILYFDILSIHNLFSVMYEGQRFHWRLDFGTCSRASSYFQCSYSTYSYIVTGIFDIACSRVFYRLCSSVGNR